MNDNLNEYQSELGQELDAENRHANKPEIADDIEILVNFAMGKGEDKENDAAARVEAWLASQRHDEIDL